MDDSNTTTKNLIIFIVILFIGIPIYMIFSKMDRWNCSEGECKKQFGGDYNSKDECVSKCSLNKNQSYRDKDNTDKDNTNKDNTNKDNIIVIKSSCQNKCGGCRGYGYYDDIYGNNYYGGYDGKVYIYGTNTFPRYNWRRRR